MDAARQSVEASADLPATWFVSNVFGEKEGQQMTASGVVGAKHPYNPADKFRIHGASGHAYWLYFFRALATDYVHLAC